MHYLATPGRSMNAASEVNYLAGLASGKTNTFNDFLGYSKYDFDVLHRP